MRNKNDGLVSIQSFNLHLLFKNHVNLQNYLHFLRTGFVKRMFLKTHYTQNLGLHQEVNSQQ